MFDFERLDVYPKMRALNKNIQGFLKTTHGIDPYLKNQFRRASISIVLNIAEGSGKYSPADKKNFYGIARGSTFECVSIIDLLRDDGLLDDKQYADYYNRLEEISKMLFGLMMSQS